MASNYRNQLEAYLKTLDVKAERVLDVGGAAKPVKDRVKTWDVGEYKIMDNGIEVGKVDTDIIADINDYLTATDEGNDSFKQFVGNPIGEGYFDAMFCIEVFEYVWKPKIALHNLATVLKHGGILHITFPFLYPIHQPVQADSLRYTPAGAEQLLQDAGFTILDRIPRRMTAEGAKLYHDFMSVEKMHPAKGEDHALLGMIYKCQKV